MGFIVTMVIMQKRLAAAIFCCGKRRIRIDPNESAILSSVNSKESVRTHIARGTIARQHVSIHSRSRIRKFAAARAQKRHSGYGRRRGSRKARLAPKLLWNRCLTVLRRLLHKYRDTRKIDRHLFRELYLKAKGNSFKNKRILLERIQTARIEKQHNDAIKNRIKTRRGAMRRATACRLMR